MAFPFIGPHQDDVVRGVAQQVTESKKHLVPLVRPRRDVTHLCLGDPLSATKEPCGIKYQVAESTVVLFTYT